MRHLAALCLLALSALAAAADRLDAPVLAAIKDATAYIKTPRGSGSGFLVKTIGNDGWVATNAHVVALAVQFTEQVVVVFDSGTGKERTLSAQVVGFDDQRDLAILRIGGERLPKPLLLQSKNKVEETMPVWVVGFPFGEALGVGGGNPAPTITPTQVSSIRADSLGNIEAIQTSGGINPGNSGGPIVNNRGGVIGVSVAKVRGAEIGFGIPAGTLEDVLAGNIVKANPVVTAGTDETIEISITATCIDPLSNITRINALVEFSSRVTGNLKTNDKGRITAPIAPGMTEVLLTYKDQVATGSTKLRVPKGSSKEVVVQFRYTRKDGTSHYTTELRGKPGNSPAAPGKGAPSTPAASGAGAVVAFTYTPPKIVTVTPPMTTAVNGTTERDASGRSFTALTAIGTVVDLGKDVLQVAAHASGKELYVIHKDDPAIAVVDPATWKTIAEIPVPESPTSIWADGSLIGVACGKSKVVALIDSGKRALIASGTLPELAKFTPDTVIGRAPDGTIMSLWQLNGGAWWDRALVHTALDGTTRIMINGEALYWATWLTNGSGVISQGNFTNSPSGTFDLAFPQGPKNFSELHNNQLFSSAGFHTDSGPAFLTADRKAIVFRRHRADPPDDRGSGPWTYLISPAFDMIIRDFPGSAIVELPEQRLFITLGKNHSNAQATPFCNYVSSSDGRVVRRIMLAPPKEGEHIDLRGVNSGAVFIPGHELLLLPQPRAGNAHGSLSFTAFRCGPVTNAVQPPAHAGATNDPPATAAVGDNLKFTPETEPGVVASEFRLKRGLPGMTIDPKTGAWSWRPGKEHVGRWTVTILATVQKEEATVISWTVEVK